MTERDASGITPGHKNDRKPNFRSDDGHLCLVRCFECGGEHGRENYAMAVSSGTCAWCGWSEAQLDGAGEAGGGK